MGAMSEGARPDSQNPYPIYDQNPRFSLSVMTKLLNIDTLFMIKIAENHILWERTYKYINMAHIREYPRFRKSVILQF